MVRSHSESTVKTKRPPVVSVARHANPTSAPEVRVTPQGVRQIERVLDAEDSA